MTQLREIAANQIELLIGCGYNKLLTKIDLSDKVNIIQTVTLHKVILGSLAELTQFRDGLAALGVLDAVKKHSYLLRSYDCSESDEKLTSGTFLF